MKKTSHQRMSVMDYPGRRRFLIGAMGMGAVALMGRDFDLQVLRAGFLQGQADARHLRVMPINAHRGMIVDRHRRPLAISTPMKSIWIDPQVKIKNSDLVKIARWLRLNPENLIQRVREAHAEHLEFVWVRRLVDPSQAQQVLAANFPGVGWRREYKRFYLMGEVGSHVLGFTNIDDQGQDGLELEFNTWLSGRSGEKRVVIDRFGHAVEDVDLIKAARPGRTLPLGLDSKIQYLAYKALKAAVVRHQARAGTIVVMNPMDGTIVAMADQPTFNPNIRTDYHSRLYRNRAVTDSFEPGSVMKPFTLAAALLSGKYKPTYEINTSPGWYKLDGHIIKDDADYGRIDMTQILEFSSNVAASKISLTLPPKLVWSVYSDVGFGQMTRSGFPGESAGILHNYTDWRPIDQATMAYGYGIAVTTLQLAQAYCCLAASGRQYPVTFLQQKNPESKRVLPAHIADTLRNMLKTVVSPQGTGYAARVPGYTVAGKTGTAHRLTDKGYAQNEYTAVFAGMIPADQPRLVCVVMIEAPQGNYFGGQVAAPVFSEVMEGAMRYLDVPPDRVQSTAISIPSRGISG